MLIKLAGEATASRRRAVYRASEKRGKLARFVDLVERGDKHDSDLDHCSAWTKARLILRVRPADVAQIVDLVDAVAIPMLMTPAARYRRRDSMSAMKLHTRATTPSDKSPAKRDVEN